MAGNKLPENESKNPGSVSEVSEEYPTSSADIKKSSGRTTTCVWISAALILVVIMLGVASYYGAGYVLAGQVEAGYADGDCSMALDLAPTITKFYPTAVAPFTESLPGITEECQLFNLASEKYEKQEWADAYLDYTSFLARYPAGPLASQARESAADSLFAWSEQLFNRGDFNLAIANYQGLLNAFSNSPHKQQARQRISEAYLGWAQNLMSANSYAAAEEKLQLAIKSDPNPHSQAGTTAQAEDILPELHLGWGDSLISTKQYAKAIEQYSTAVTFFTGEDVAMAKDVLAEGYLQWASALQNQDDFYAALDRVDMADENASSSSVAAEVDAVRADTLNTFAFSSGDQAHELMDSIAEVVCDTGKVLDTLPIFGIDDNRIRTFIEGVEADFSSAVVSQRPASMHYVACVSTELKTIQSCPYTGSRTGNRYTINRKVVHWIVQLRDAVTGNVVSTRDFAGEAPKVCPKSASFRVGQSTVTYRGTSPDTETIESWLLSIFE